MEDVAHRQKWRILEVFIVAHSLVALLLQAILQMNFLSGVLGFAVAGLGILLFLASLIFINKSRSEFKKHSQPTDPGLMTTELITVGMFAKSRNPLSIGSLGILLSIGLILGNPWFIFLIPTTAVGMYIFLIKPEESYLKKNFGSQYIEYCRRTPRWLF